MKVEIEYGAVDPLGAMRANASKNEGSNDLFAGLLNQQIEKNESSIGQEDRKPNKYADDIAAIKDKGFTAYLKDLEAEKREDLRNEILEAMGITEEDLANMPAEQRASIEKMISDEIQKRLLATAMMDNGNEEGTDLPPLEQIMPGMGTGFAFLSAMEETGNADPYAITPEDEDR